MSVLKSNDLPAASATPAPTDVAFAGARCDAVVAHVLPELLRQGLLRR
ncbi:MAG: hypothetical protein M3150_02990 [Pseudomonadota bacterium]|nr:hypothetical protein [Pseudomonadota bacterium]